MRQHEIEKLSRQFKELREWHGLSQPAAAKLMGVGESTLQLFEYGRGEFKRVLPKFREQVARWKEAKRQGELEAAVGADRVAHPPPPKYGGGVVCGSCGEDTSPAPGVNRQPLFCMWCGARVGIQCAGCGHVELRLDAKFCLKCGESLVAGAGVKGSAVGKVKGRKEGAA